MDLAFHGAEKQLEFDLLVSPGVSPDKLTLKFSGATQLRTDASGGLVVSSPAGDLRLHKPLAYQENNGVREPVDARFVIKGNNVAFELGAYDASRQLVIDPTVTYATYLGGSTEDDATAVAVDANGNAYITGQTNSANLASFTPTGLGPGGLLMSLCANRTHQDPLFSILHAWAGVPMRLVNRLSWTAWAMRT